jgi:hypothetical protein
MRVFKLESRPAVAHEDVEAVKGRRLDVDQHLSVIWMRRIEVPVGKNFGAAVLV